MMILAKALTVLAAGALTAVAMKRIMDLVEQSKVKVRVKPEPRAVRLRRDPRTGVYFPEA
jgi:hypothetical protein